MSEMRREAPESVERRLVAAFRQHHEARGARQRLAWGGAALAVAAALVAISFLWLRPSKITVPPRPSVVAKGVVRGADPEMIPPAAPAPHRKARRPHHVAAPPPVQPPAQPEVAETRESPAAEEVTTGFMPMGAFSMLPTSGEVIRMEVPRSTLSMFGLPVNEQRLSVPVRADVVFGEDGMARAIRFVTTKSYETHPER